MLGLVEPPATLGVPSPKFHENVYGDVPPDAVAVKLIGLPTVPVFGIVEVMAKANGAIVIVADAEVLVPVASVAFTLTVKVPFTLYV